MMSSDALSVAGGHEERRRRGRKSLYRVIRVVAEKSTLHPTCCNTALVGAA